MNRNDLQKLSNARVREAKILFTAGEYSGAYYLAGYAVECALKACFARGVKRYDFPDKGRSNKLFTHDLMELVRQAGLSAELEAGLKSDLHFAARWGVAIQWRETSRYSASTKNEAEAILDAILKKKEGVLPWIKRRW